MLDTEQCITPLIGRAPKVAIQRIPRSIGEWAPVRGSEKLPSNLVAQKKPRHAKSKLVMKYNLSSKTKLIIVLKPASDFGFNLSWNFFY